MTPLTVYRDRRLPRPASLAGYSFLLNYFSLDLPLPFELHAVADRNAREKADGWVVHPASRWPGDEPIDHLLFAIKNEPLALRVLAGVFDRLPPDTLVTALRQKPGGQFVRRACFLYEWLTGRRLADLPPVTGAVTGAIDPKVQYGLQDAVPTIDTAARRYRVRNNLPGTSAFCPLVARTHRLDALIKRDLHAEAERVVSSRPPEMVRRASAYLLLRDSKASFSIEDETPDPARAQRWAGAIGEAGRHPLSADLLGELQRIIIGDDRFVRLGLRDEGVFLGRRDPFGQPQPDHIGARPEDLADLTEGLIAFDRRTTSGAYHPVLAATSLAFGFVYIHPFEDGNGRLHRWLFHHVLAARRFSPDGIIFPVSAAIEHAILLYRDTLEGVTRPMLPHIAWRATERGNVHVTNDTARLYRYFNATRNAEYLFDCIVQTIEHDLSEELDFLEIRDAFHRRGTTVVDMPERLLDTLLHVLRQNGGSLSKRKRRGAFAKLTADEIETFERLYAELIDAQNEEGLAEAAPSLFD